VKPGRITQKLAGEYETDGKTYLRFQTGDGILELLELQLEGKKRMKIDELLRGYKLGG
jgi:methionyl-tRNA formyltransferase